MVSVSGAAKVASRDVKSTGKLDWSCFAHLLMPLTSRIQLWLTVSSFQGLVEDNIDACM